MLENGYIKTYRSFVKWEWYTDANTMRLFFHLLLTVNYEPQKWKGVEVQRGQRISSYSKIAAELNLTVKQLRTALNHLIRTGEVAHQSTSEYSLFTVLNYNKYQGRADEQADEGHSEGIPTADEGHSEGNNERSKETNKAKRQKGNKKDSVSAEPSLAYDIDSTEYLAVQFLINSILKNNPNAKVPSTDVQINNWCDAANKILRIDKKPVDEFKKVLQFATTDSFWSSNILSMSKFREKYDQLYARMNSNVLTPKQFEPQLTGAERLRLKRLKEAQTERGEIFDI